jgi:8-oxo-dGTP pyrophosphatase MutT (NUDIX family)
MAAPSRRKKPVKRARSAGGVVFFRGAAGEVRILVLQHEGGKWMLPKGTIESGETPEAVAVREVREETGLSQVRIVQDLGEERYSFFWRTEDAFYQREEGFVAVEWVSLDEAMTRIKYKETREIVRRARDALAPSVANSTPASEGGP